MDACMPVSLHAYVYACVYVCLQVCMYMHGVYMYISMWMRAKSV